MRKYYVVETYQRKGPYNLEELKAYGVTKETMIWCFEFDEPKPAGSIPELSGLFIATEQQQDNQPQKPDEFDKENISGTPFDVDETPPPPPDSEQEKPQENNITPPPPPEADKQQDLNIPPPPDNQNNVPPPPPDSEQEKPQENITPPPPPEADKQQDLNIPPPPDNQNNVPPPPPDSEQEKPQENITPPPPPEEQQQNTQKNNQQTTRHTQLKNYNVPSSTTTAPMPNTYLALSIITTLFCCLILGIISIVFSSQVKKKYEEGDYEGALSASKTALILNIVAIIGGLIAFATLMIMENY